jgi:hypothetical protein
MPQRATRSSLLANLQRQTSTALVAVIKEIQQREHELVALKAEAARWQSVLREPAGGKRPTAPPPRKRSRKRRWLDWTAILKELPARFTSKDVAQKTGKPLAQAYASVSRWVKEKKVRRGKDGYEKV